VYPNVQEAAIIDFDREGEREERVPAGSTFQTLSSLSSFL
jgi:hypothetical protein